MYIIKHIHKFNTLKRRFMGGSSGFALIGLVITMIIFAILGVAIVKMFSTASMNEVLANLAHKAQYMAESGYRYAASQYRNINTGDDKDTVLSDIHAKTYSLTPDPLGFDLKVSSYFYQYNNNPTSPVGTAFGTVSTDILDYTGTVGTGKIGIFNLGFLTGVGTYSGYTKAATSITFNGPTGWSAGSRLFPVVSPIAVTQVNILGNNIQLSSGTDNDLSLLPAKNGSFRIYKEDKFAKYPDLLQYQELNGTTLTGISRINGTSTGMTIAPTDYIVLQRFINLESTGKAGSDASSIFASRKFSYQVPVEAFPFSNPPTGGELEKGNKNIFDIPLSNPPRLMDNPEFSVLPALKTYEAVIQATGVNIQDTHHPGITNNNAISIHFPNDVYDVHVNINWWRLVDRGLGLDFNQAYHVQDDSLSYDAQLKMRTWKQLGSYMVGISFRMNNNNVGGNSNKYYGVSLFRSTSGAVDNKGNYPTWLGNPEGTLGNPGEASYKLANLTKDRDYVVLWKRVAGTITLLRAEDLTGIINLNPYNEGLYYVDWGSIVVRLKETESSGMKTNNFKIVVYDLNQNLLGTFKWPTETEWNTPLFSLTDNSITTQGLSDIPIPTQDPPNSGNYLEGCESCTSCASPGVCGWPEIGIHVFADVNPDQKLYLDDFSVKLLGGGGPAGGSVGFQP